MIDKKRWDKAHSRGTDCLSDFYESSPTKDVHTLVKHGIIEARAVS